MYKKASLLQWKMRYFLFDNSLDKPILVKNVLYFITYLPMVKPMKLGLVVGGFISLLHLIWVLAIAIMPIAMQNFIDWIFQLHFLEPVYVLAPATRGNGIILVLLTFVIGWIMGLILGTLWNSVHKK